MPRSTSPVSSGNLVRLGFQDGSACAEAIGRIPGYGEALLAVLVQTPDPDRALLALVELADLVEDRSELLDTLVGDEETALRLLCVLGMSDAMAHHLHRHPEHWHELRDPLLDSTRPTAETLRASLSEAVNGLDHAAAVDALRVEYRRLLLRLMSRDLVHGARVDDVAAELSDLAAATLDAALVIARAKVGESAASCRLAVVAMGKCGGHELNYVSDVDVIFVAEAVAEESTTGAPVSETAALRAASQLAATMMQVCSEPTAAGTIWPVDANLRPEGKSGPLVRTLASHAGYYERWAKTWEFQALLKARPVAGDLDLGERYLEVITPMIWAAAERDGFVADVQAMRRRVLDHIPADEAERQLKLGSGGLRDVEFAVQLMQLVHGRTDTSIRARSTLGALAELTDAGYVGREDGQSLTLAYAFLRRLEHRMQMVGLRRTHVIPTDEEQLRRLARSMGHLSQPVTSLQDELNHHRREVRRLHEKLFYRPLLSAVARIPGDGVRLTPEAAEQRLSALGYLDPAAALRHLEALTSGVSRTAAIQRTLLPVMLEWFADAPDPDAGLFGFRKISEALGSTHWYLKMLRDEGRTAERLAAVLATSRYATDLLQREPEGVRILGSEEDLFPLALAPVLAEMRAMAHRREGAEAKILGIRSIRRRELLRVSVSDLTEPFDVTRVSEALSDLTTATLQSALEVAIGAVEEQRGVVLPTAVAVVAMGRYGGHELGYGSDADVMFVHDPLPGADAQVAGSMAQAVANEFRRLLALPATDPPLEVDADLRPEGKQGPLVRTLDSYRAYYAKWSAVWEAQALLRADALVGDPDLCRRFTEMIDPIRFPDAGIGEAEVREVRRIKARVDGERLPKGADPATHFKLGRGGLADVEWTVQLLQMRHSHAVPGLRTTRTLAALGAAQEAGLVAEDAVRELSEAWRFASRARNATVLVRGKPSDQLPRDIRERAAVAAVLQYPPGHTDEMVNDYQRAARLARGVVDSVFWE